eukprot:Hpha_TRINITY_DN15292_c8_g3::TRINITY_DN15292_c8_g3_i1::g.68336::m.68336
MDPQLGIDRARPFAFVDRLPRGTVEEVGQYEKVRDRQVLLNELWWSYCDRIGHPEWKPQEAERDKWVTETWDEREQRRRKQPAALEAFNQKVDERNAAAAAAAGERLSRAHQVLADIRKRDAARKAELLPVLNTLMVDFDEKREREQRAEREDLEGVEQAARRVIEAELADAVRQLMVEESESLKLAREKIEIREEEEMNRQRELELQRAREEEERELAKARAEEEDRARKREEEEEKKRKEQEEKDRKARERREKLKAERERRKSIEEEAAQRRDSRRRSSLSRDPKDLRRGSLAMQMDMRRDEAREKRLQRQEADMKAYLEKLQAKVREVKDKEAVLRLLKETAEELGSEVIFDCSVYIAVNSDGELHYKYASPNSSPVLRAGHEKLPIAQHPECPTVKHAVTAKETIVFPAVLADPPDGCADIVRVGTKEGRGTGDFFSTPIFDAAKDVAAVLSADTLSQLNGQQHESTLKDGEEDSYLGEPPLPAVSITDPIRDFLVAVAALLSDAYVRGFTPRVSECGTISDLYAQLTKSVTQLLGDGTSCYIAMMPCANGESLTVVAHDGSIEPHPSNVVGKSLKRTDSSPSFKLPTEPGKWDYCADVIKDDAIRSYRGDVEKKNQYLLLLPVLVRHKGGLAVGGVVGVEGPSEKPLSDDQIGQVIEVVAQLNDTRPKLMKGRLCKQLAAQCVQWCQALSGCQHVYLACRDSLLWPDGVGPEGDAETKQMRYVAASKSQKWVVGKTLAQEEGVTWSVLGKGTNVRHIPDVKKEQTVHYLRKHEEEGEPQGQLLVAPILSGKGEPFGAIYMDTVAWEEGKKNFTKADIEMMEAAAKIMGMLLDKLDSGEDVLQPEDGEQELLIETEFSAGPVRFLKLVWLNVVQQLNAMKRDEFLEIGKYNKPPDAIPPVCAASCIVTGAKPKAVKEWEQTRKRFKHERVKKMSTFDPTKGKPPRAFFARAKKMIKGCTVDFVARAGSKPVSLVFFWTYVNVQLRYASVRLRKLYEQGQLELFEPDEAFDDGATEAASSIGDDTTEADPEEEIEGAEDDGEGEEEAADE